MPFSVRSSHFGSGVFSEPRNKARIPRVQVSRLPLILFDPHGTLVMLPRQLQLARQHRAQSIVRWLGIFTGSEAWPGCFTASC